jgi:HD-GYP domain-containing protein (c-di-GMP phosphodiesterase class II)
MFDPKKCSLPGRYNPCKKICRIPPQTLDLSKFLVYNNLAYSKNKGEIYLEKLRINLKDLLLCLSNAQDLILPNLSSHQQQVAYLSLRLGEQLKLPQKQLQGVFLAGLVHDIGALSASEMLELIETEPADVNDHAFRGTKLLEGFKPLKKCANIIKFHHLPWEDGKGISHKGEKVLFDSHILHLADRVCSMIKSDKNVITQLPGILAQIRMSAGAIFIPALVDALEKLAEKEFIWLDLVTRNPVETIKNDDLFNKLVLEIDDIIDLAHVFSHIIDFRSSFTSLHSAGVAVVAERLARLVGFSPYECKMMLVAGYLHDIGKIAISNDVLEKPAKLDEYEFNEMRAHTYYTFRLLQPIEQFQTINVWASFHHERLDGNGYPFHIRGENLFMGSRIMAVADVFTAITENRPYRKGMAAEEAMKVLQGQVENGALDGRIVDILLDSFKEINTLRAKAQKEAAEKYEKFLLI